MDGLRDWIHRGVRRWFGGPRGGDAGAGNASRWVVVDVETTGLDVRQDRLLAIAAVAVQVDGATPQLPVADTFEVVLRNEPAVVDKANILVHQIGVGAQRAGVEPDQALRAFEAWLGDAPLLAYHAAFDQAMIERALRAHLGRGLTVPWADLADVAPVVQPSIKAESLDDWMDHFGIRCAVRHQAAADAWATAELLVSLWPAIRHHLRRGEDRPVSHRDLQRLAAHKRWLVASS